MSPRNRALIAGWILLSLSLALVAWSARHNNDVLGADRPSALSARKSERPRASDVAEDLGPEVPPASRPLGKRRQLLHPVSIVRTVEIVGHDPSLHWLSYQSCMFTLIDRRPRDVAS